MSTRTITYRPGGYLTLVLRADYLDTEIIAEEGRTEAVAELHGPQEIIGKVISEDRPDSWRLEWPQGEGGGSVTTVSGPGFRSTMVTGGRGVVIAGGNIVMSAGGRIRVNGVDVSSLTGSQEIEPLRAVIRVPALSARVRIDLSAGSVVTRGSVHSLSAQTQSADIRCEGPVGHVSCSTQSGDLSLGHAGLVEFGSMSGDLDIASAMAAVSAKTMSGDAHIHAIDNIMVSFSSMSGDCTVTSTEGLRPQVSGSSMSGRVRVR